MHDIFTQLSREERKKSVCFQWIANHESLGVLAVKRKYQLSCRPEEVYRDDWDALKIKAFCLLNAALSELVPVLGIQALAFYFLLAGKDANLSRSVHADWFSFGLSLL